MCTFDTNTIYLSWNHTRIIASLTKEKDNIFCFKYLSDKQLQETSTNGLQNYPAFADIHKEYRENVLSVFKRRLVDKSRKDFDEFIGYWHCQQYKNDDFALLGLTGVKLLTDNFEFIAPHNEMPALFYTEIVRFDCENAKVLEFLKEYENVNVSFEQEKNNPIDKKAIRVILNDFHFGYIKSIHCGNIYFALENKFKIESKIDSCNFNGKINNILLEVSINNDNDVIL
jgi:hypothetical protein